MGDYYHGSRYGGGLSPKVLAIALAAIVGLVMLGLGFYAGRASAPAARPATAAPASGPGPTRVENGVPVGYAHTSEGAVAAATNFLEVRLGPMMFSPDQYRAAMDTMAAPET